MNDGTGSFRLMTYRSHEEGPGTVHIGLDIDGRIIDLDDLTGSHSFARQLSSASTTSLLTPGVQGLLTDWERNFDALYELAMFVRKEGFEHVPWQQDVFSLEEVHVLAPILRPTKMLYAGANYEQHVREAEKWEGSQVTNFRGIDKTNTQPYAFIKMPYCIIGPYDPIIYPREYQQLDWEVELALVIGRRGKHISTERAMDYVAGFMIANDVSLRQMTNRRDWPFLHTDWLAGKNFDTSAPLGPYFVPRQFVPEHLNLHLSLRVNNVTKQDSSTRHMVFTPEEIIAFVSSFVTLEPGDVIATGTPPGAGFSTGNYLKVGDIVEAEVEGLGLQRNVIVTEEESGFSTRAVKRVVLDGTGTE